MARPLGRINHLLLPDEQYLWHAPIAVGGKRPEIGFPMIILILGTIATVTAAIAAGPVWLLLTGVFVYAYYSMFKFITEPYHTLIATDKRLLVVTPRMKMESEFPYERIETKPVGGGVLVCGHRGELTIKWICAASARHVAHLTHKLPETPMRDERSEFEN